MSIDSNLSEPEPVQFIPETLSETEISENKIESAKEINFKKFREQRDIERKRMAELEREKTAQQSQIEAMKAAMEALVNKPERPSLEDEDVEALQAKKIAELVKSEVEKVRASDRMEAERREQEMMLSRLSSMFPDFNEVCSQQNLDYLDFHEPDISKTLQSAKNDINKWSAIYKLAKRMIPNPMSKKEELKIEKNLAKPKSLSIPGLTQTGDSVVRNELTEERKRDNWARMQKARKTV